MNDLKNQDWLVIANGPEFKDALHIKDLMDRKIIALDGAIHSCFRNDITPNIVLGDFDSIDKDIIDDVERKLKIKFSYLPEQDTTDLEKGLRYIATLEPKSVIICQAFGARIDHSIHNLRLLRRLHHLINDLSLVTDTEKVYFIKDKTFIVSATNQEPIALVSFPEATVKSQGLKFDMDNLLLKFSERESTSNFLHERSARISVKGEILLIISHNTELLIY